MNRSRSHRRLLGARGLAGAFALIILALAAAGAARAEARPDLQNLPLHDTAAFRIPDQAAGLKVESQNPLSNDEMEVLWKRLVREKRWSALFDDFKGKGYARMEDPTRQWGMQGQIRDEKGESANAIFCIWDFSRNGGKESGALIYALKGSDDYMAYITMPPGATDITAASEWYVDDAGKVQEAHSWKTCMRKTLGAKCATPCVGAIPTCLALATLGGPFSPAAFIGCLAVICGSCLFIVNLICAAG